MSLTRSAVRGSLAAAVALLITSAAVAATHTVRTGDTLWELSRKYGVSTQAIARANGFSENSTLQPGQKLTIPGSSSSSSAMSNSSSASGGRQGIVQRSAPLRAEPSTQGKRLGTLPAGTRVRILQTKWDWHQVRTPSGSTGWVGGFLVKVTQSAPAPSARSGRHPAPAKTAARPSAAPAPPPSAESSSAVRTAMNHLGDRYRYGGSSRGGFDCSGFTRYVYAKHGVVLPHNSAAQFQKGTPVSKSELQPGDLVFFSRGGKRIGHVGVYVGNGKFVHASNPRGGVRVDSLTTGTYARTYVGARRVK
ncbi:MAG: NlpC/P60 family protein [Armatimonadota bacterium]